MQPLQDIYHAFQLDAPRVARLLSSIDFFAKLTSAFQKIDPVLLAHFVEAHHPAHVPAHEHTSVGIGGAYRTRAEISGAQIVRAQADALIEQQAALTPEHLAAFARHLSQRLQEPGTPLYSPTPAQVKRLHTQEVMFQGAHPRDFLSGMEYLLACINRPEGLHPLLTAALAHYLLVFIHPFTDGNGRTARMLSTHVMRTHGYRLRHPAYEHYYVWNATRYQQALDFNGDFYTSGAGLAQVHAWNDYFLGSVLEAYKALFRALVACKLQAFKQRLGGKPVEAHRVISPAPAGAAFHVPNKWRLRYGALAGAWKYTDAEGGVIGWNVRFAGTKGNGFRKAYQFFQYFSDGTWQPHFLKATQAMPLYGLDALARFTGHTLILCEGEKCADALNALLPPAYFALAWCTGAQQVAESDWSPLYAHPARLLIWRDNDETGAQAQAQLAELLTQNGSRVSALNTTCLADRPAKWDAADAAAEGMTQAEMVGFLEENAVAL